MAQSAGSIGIHADQIKGAEIDRQTVQISAISFSDGTEPGAGVVMPTGFADAETIFIQNLRELHFIPQNLGRGFAGALDVEIQAVFTDEATLTVAVNPHQFGASCQGEFAG